MKNFIKNFKIMPCLFLFIFVFAIWAFVMNGVPLFAYKSVLKIDKLNDAISLTLYPSKRVLNLGNYEGVISLENKFTPLYFLLQRKGYRAVSPSHHLQLVRQGKELSIFPSMRGYEIESKITQIKVFEKNSQSIYVTEFANRYNLYAFCLVMFICILFFATLCKGKEKDPGACKGRN